MKKFFALFLACVMLICALTTSVFAANKWGDIYTDQQVDSKDAVKLAQYLAQWSITLSADERSAADVFYDGNIDSKDAVKLAQYLAGWDVTLGTGSNPTTPPSSSETIPEYEIPADSVV